MAKSKSKTSSEAAPPVLDAETVVEEEEELVQVDLGDFVKLKQVLDEAVTQALLLQHATEDVSWDNVKLWIMTIACGFAMVAQFAPIPFPESRPVLGVCGTCYFLLSGVLQFITTFIDKDCILLTRNPDLKVRTTLPRFSQYYTVLLEENTKEKSSATTSVVQETWSVGQFFDKEGYFDEVGLSQEVDKLVVRYLAETAKSSTQKKTQ